MEHLDAEDFEKFRARLAKTMGVVALATEIQRARVVFRFAYLQRLVHQPVRYDDFKPPSKKTLRLARHAKGPRMFEATDLRNLLDRAGTQLKAMLLLGINCGMGNSDVGHLEFRHANLETGWVDYPRPKTGVLRRCHLWPETVAALSAAIAARPEPKDAGHAKLVFITKPGAPWFKSTSDNPISRVMAVPLKELKLHRPGLNFYALRHTFETVAGESRDQVAVDHIMGRARDDMASVYRERISDERLKAVSEHVRRWLFPPKKRASKGSQR